MRWSMKHTIVLTVLVHSLSLTAATQFCAKPSTFLQEPAPLELAMNSTVPASFGRTHFIVGYPTHHAVAEENRSPGTPKITSPLATPQVFFTPDDNIRDELVRYISQETEKI